MPPDAGQVYLAADAAWRPPRYELHMGTRQALCCNVLRLFVISASYARLALLYLSQIIDMRVGALLR